LKVSTLLTQYLYQNKQLTLAGIGEFSIPSSVSIPDANDKNFHEFLQHIEFTPRPSSRLDDNLVDFIRQKTGKIKPLAESDLDSFISDCKTLLNIGKPLYLEGIGTLQKNKDGRYDFVHGLVMSERTESLQNERPIERQTDKKFLYRTEYTEQASQSNVLRRVLMAGGVIVGLGVIIWGGYLLYSKKTDPQTDSVVVENGNQGTTSISPDTASMNGGVVDSPSVNPPDTAVSRRETAPVVSNAQGYKFICEVTNTRARALSRFQKLRELSSQYQMETRDSVHFTIFVRLPAAPSDTARIKDSLKAWYWGTRDRYIRIEQ
jgi:hypothetical protein